MSGSSSWLSKQRKSELTELAEQFNVKISETFNKSEIAEKLEEYLNAHPQLSSDSRVASFFNRRSVSSPVKKEASAAAESASDAIKVVKRKTTKAASDIKDAVVASLPDEDEIEPAISRAVAQTKAVTRTPRAAALRIAQSVPLPPSPAQVSDYVDRNAVVIRSRLNKIYEKSGVMEHAQATRETLSTVVSVEVLIILFEAFCLRYEVLADRYAFTIPGLKLLGTSDYPVKIPDMFLLLTSSFWGPATLWTITSLIVPLLASYFFNLTSKPRTGRSHMQHFNYSFDPMIFNIVKALLTWVIYEKDVTFGGLVDLEYVARINSALYGGPTSVLVGCAIGVLITFYEAIIKK